MRTLFDDLPEVDADTLQARFEAWLAVDANQAIYQAFRQAALDMRRAGRKRFGAKAITEKLRYESSLYSVDPEGWKINNSIVSRLARKLLAECPELEGFLELRKLQRD